jgi:hypothetical protein
MTAAPHPRFPVQGHILSTGGDALIDLISLNQLSAGRNVICNPIGWGFGINLSFQRWSSILSTSQNWKKKKLLTTITKNGVHPMLLCLHYRYPGQLYYIKSFLGCNLMELIELPCIYLMQWRPSHPHNCVTLASIQYMKCIYSTAKIHESVAGAVDNL